MVAVGGGLALSAVLALCVVLCLLLLRRDRRRLRLGAALLLAAFWGLALVAHLVLQGRPAPPPTGEMLLQVAGGLGLAGALVLGLTVVVGALAVSRRESGPSGRVLTGIGGIALLLSPLALQSTAGGGNPLVAGASILAGGIAIHLGLVYLAFLAATAVHQLLPSRRAGAAIIVLGSTLRDGRVPPLLRRRLDRAVAERDRLLALGLDPLLVPSGGKGDAQTPAESEAMAAHLTGPLGLPADRVRAETASRTTEENLIFSHRLLEESGLQGPYIVCTSGYHAFRAALLARRLGFDDEVVGGPTALSYLPTATLREFVLTMSYRLRWILGSLPLTLGLVALLLRAG